MSFNPRSHEGSDVQQRLLSIPLHCFNPRSHEGSDSEHQGTINWSQVFQSTLPRRERPAVFITSCYAISVSIHAPTKGATPTSLLVTANPTCFNPRSHEGSDFALRMAFLRALCFNPRSHEGSDKNMLLFS